MVFSFSYHYIDKVLVRHIYTIVLFEDKPHYFIYENENLLATIWKPEKRWQQSSGEKLNDRMIKMLGSAIETNSKC